MTHFRKYWSALARWQKGLAITALLLVLYALAGFFLLPRAIHYVLTEKVSHVLQRRIDVGEVRCNPFALTVDVEDFALAGKDSDKKIASFDGLHANLELSSLFRLAVVLHDVRLHGPRLHIRLDENGKSNFEDLISSGSPEKKDSPNIFPVIAKPFELQNGTVIFEDEARGVTHTVDEVLFHLPHFSSRKKDWEVFMNPVLSFRLNGAPFHLQGQTIPFHNTLKTEFSLELTDLPLPKYWAYVPVSKKLALSKGSLTLENKLAFEQHEGKLPTFSIQGSVTGRDIEMTGGGQTVFTAERMQVVMDDLSILNLNVGLKSVSLDKPFLRVTRGKNGAVNWAEYFTQSKSSPAAGKASATARTNSTLQANSTVQTSVLQANGTNQPNSTAQVNDTQMNATARTAEPSINPERNAATTGPARAESPEDMTRLLLRIPSLTINGGRIQFLDETTKTPFSREASGLTLTVKDLSTAENATAEAILSLNTNARESITANATFSIVPMRFKAHVAARDLDIPSCAPYFQDALPLRLDSARTDARFSVVMDGPEAKPRLENGRIEVRELKLGVPEAPDAVTVKRAVLDAIAVDLKARSIRTGVLAVDEPKIITSTDRNGHSILMSRLASGDTPQQEAPRSAEPAPAWTMQLDGVNVTGAALRIQDKTPREPVRLNKLQVEAIAVDTGKHTAAIRKAALTFGLDVRMLENGEADLARLFSPAPGSGKKRARSGGKPQSGEAVWNARLEQFLVADSQFRLIDETLAAPLDLSVDQISLDAKKLSTDLAAAIPFTFSCRVEETGSIKAEGDLAPSPLASKGNLRLSRLPLALAAPHVAGVAAVDIPSGWLDGRLDWRVAPKGAGEISGALQAGDLRVTERRSKTEIGGLKALELQNVQASLSPLSISVDQILLMEPRGSLVIDADGNSTISRIMPVKDKTAGKDKSAASEEKSGRKTSLDIKTLTVRKGRLSFKDKSLSPQFASTITPIDMTATGISLDPARRVQIDLSAMIDGSAPITAKGWVAPLKNPVEANSTVTLRNLDLVGLSPYSSRFIAYPVTKGQLDWDMKVNTQASKLTMGNAITARQLQLGDKVKSPDAVDAPVKLGLSLLRDMSGNIVITLPVRGDLNDPKFSIGGIVAQAFLGLILKAVTSPFSLLGSLIPAGTPDLSHLQFPAGMSTPGPETMTALQTLADVLGKRPAMNISVTGQADPETDRRAMFELQFLRKLQVVKYADLSRREREETTPEQLEITAEEYPDLLWQAYKDEPVEKEKNALGIHREVPREVQEEKLRELIRVTDDDLVRLAASRAEFIRNYLVGELKVDPNRVFLGPTGPKALSGKHEVTVEIKQ